MQKIIKLLAQKSARLSKRETGDIELAVRRQNLTKYLSRNFVPFNHVKDYLFHGGQRKLSGRDEQVQHVIERLMDMDMIVASPRGSARYRLVDDAGVRRYLGGGWLEELAWLATLEAGADDALFSQVIEWETTGYEGRNEVDVLARVRNHLLFISCKALKPDFHAYSNVKAKLEKLTYFLHEADNLADHFGSSDDKVVLIITTDLIDEAAGDKARFPQIFGKAEALGVTILGLEDLRYEILVDRLREIVGNI
ncbi:Card1-like endonuclease domain-containing protein [Luteithermobacter gelatinilyticus]|uniref:Card1-like endonuclease domain-containing protein n=1 Tax=Luteithermobacter gelatinilyticus TaxID=2582913 RepID=UPI0011074227|nr:DUF1887 family CARF protein [Luteithermobacter gelatinilyticus]|tara:strand:+ start:77 stop:832 length:756 start_codon:yes stop_codon:yes gene_type:complete